MSIDFLSVIMSRTIVDVLVSIKLFSTNDDHMPTKIKNWGTKLNQNIKNFDFWKKKFQNCFHLRGQKSKPTQYMVIYCWFWVKIWIFLHQLIHNFYFKYIIASLIHVYIYIEKVPKLTLSKSILSFSASFTWHAPNFLLGQNFAIA